MSGKDVKRPERADTPLTGKGVFIKNVYNIRLRSGFLNRTHPPSTVGEREGGRERMERGENGGGGGGGGNEYLKYKTGGKADDYGKK